MVRFARRYQSPRSLPPERSRSLRERGLSPELRSIGRGLDDMPTLLVVGALSGALAGVATVAFVLLGTGLGVREFSIEAAAIGAEIGGPLGVVLFPLGLRLAIPHVRLGLAAAVMVVATTALATLAFFFPHSAGNALVRAIGGGIIGFVLAVFALGLMTDAESSRSASRSDTL